MRSESGPAELQPRSSAIMQARLELSCWEVVRWRCVRALRQIYVVVVVFCHGRFLRQMLTGVRWQVAQLSDSVEHCSFS